MYLLVEQSEGDAPGIASYHTLEELEEAFIESCGEDTLNKWMTNIYCFQKDNDRGEWKPMERLRARYLMGPEFYYRELIIDRSVAGWEALLRRQLQEDPTA